MDTVESSGAVVDQPPPQMGVEGKRAKIRSNYETIEVLRKRLQDKKRSEQTGMTRATYIKMIFDVTRKFDKQNDELSKAILETRRLQRDISNLTGRLDRSFALVKSTILKDAKSDAWTSECYCLLNKLIDDCDQIVKAVQETGELKREIRQLEDQMGRVIR